MFAHSLQMEELTIIEQQLGVSELVSCRRASNQNFVDVSCTWVFSVGCCPHGGRSQILTMIVSVYSTVCTFETRRVRCVQSDLGQGNWL